MKIAQTPVGRSLKIAVDHGGLDVAVHLTGDPLVPAALATNARWMRDMLPLDHEMESYALEVLQEVEGRGTTARPDPASRRK